MKKTLATLLLCATLCAAGQKLPIDYKTALSFNPSVLVGTDYTAMVGIEHRISENTGLVLDAGYLFYSSYFEIERVRNTSGFSLRPGIRRYFGRRLKEYLQVQAYYKHANYFIYDWLGKECVNEVPSYEQLKEFTYRKQTLSFNLMAGELFQFSDRLAGELYVGIGIKIKRQGPTESNACYRNQANDVVFNMYRERSVGPNIPVGFKLLYLLQ